MKNIHLSVNSATHNSPLREHISSLLMAMVLATCACFDKSSTDRYFLAKSDGDARGQHFVGGRRTPQDTKAESPTLLEGSVGGKHMQELRLGPFNNAQTLLEG